jgi:predicted glycosyltransferase
VRVWIDLTAAAHVLVFRPLIRLLREQGHEVEVTSREYGQTHELLRLHGIEATVVGVHGGASRLRKLEAMASRLPALVRWARSRSFDVALAHGSHELTLAARLRGVPSATTFDYEYATLQHQLGCRAATRVVVPEAIPPERLRRYGVRPPKLLRYPGLKEEYYLADFEADPGALARLGLDPARVLVVVRPPADIAAYHLRVSNTLFPQVLDRLGRDGQVQAVVVPRTDEQRDAVRALELPSLVVPDGAVDAQSLIAFADLVVSAGGTMNREAVALGTPVYTVFGGRLGGVDEWLIGTGRLKPLADARDLEIRKRDRADATRTRRDPQLLLSLLLSAAGDAFGRPPVVGPGR